MPKNLDSNMITIPSLAKYIKTEAVSLFIDFSRICQSPNAITIEETIKSGVLLVHNPCISLHILN